VQQCVARGRTTQQRREARALGTGGFRGMYRCKSRGAIVRIGVGESAQLREKQESAQQPQQWSQFARACRVNPKSAHVHGQSISGLFEVRRPRGVSAWDIASFPKFQGQVTYVPAALIEAY